MKILLDCHIAKATVAALRQRLPSVQAEHLASWRKGAFLRASDADILEACQREHRILVTYDQRTIPALLRLWASEQKLHSGVIFADNNTIKANNPGLVAAALVSLLGEIAKTNTTNIVRYLRPVDADKKRR